MKRLGILLEILSVMVGLLTLFNPPHIQITRGDAIVILLTVLAVPVGFGFWLVVLIVRAQLEPPHHG